MPSCRTETEAQRETKMEATYTIHCITNTQQTTQQGTCFTSLPVCCVASLIFLAKDSQLTKEFYYSYYYTTDDWLPVSTLVYTEDVLYVCSCISLTSSGANNSMS